MARLTRSPAATLPPELVFHVVRLALEETDVLDTRAGERGALFRFASVCRAWHNQAIRWPRLTVVSEEEATWLASKLERDAVERRKHASGRATRSTVAWLSSPPRYLVIYHTRSESGKPAKAYRALVRGCPDLKALTLVTQKPDVLDNLLPALQRASRASGPNLRSQIIAGNVSEPSTLVSYLACFPGLEKLDLSVFHILNMGNEPTVELPSPFLTHLNDFQVYVDLLGLHHQLFNALVNSSPSLQSLTLSHGFHTLPEILPFLSSALSRLAPNLLHFTCEPLNREIDALEASQSNPSPSPSIPIDPSSTPSAPSPASVRSTSSSPPRPPTSPPPSRTRPSNTSRSMSQSPVGALGTTPGSWPFALPQRPLGSFQYPTATRL